MHEWERQFVGANTSILNASQSGLPYSAVMTEAIKDEHERISIFFFQRDSLIIALNVGSASNGVSIDECSGFSDAVEIKNDNSFDRIDVAEI